MAVINSSLPSSWRDLQQQVANILRECGLEVAVEKDVQTTRDTVNIDVYAEDPEQKPESICLCECKHWKSAVPKTVVHAFRTVVGDYGANWGFIISSAGFQSGAFEAAANTNVRLLNWEEFQALFVDRWMEKHMPPRLRAEAEPLVNYTEPVNSRVFRKADALTDDKQQQFIALRKQYADLAFFALHLYLPFPGREITLPLPLKDSLWKGLTSYPILPKDLLEMACYRGLLDALCGHLRKGIAEFDEVFGGRA